MALATRLDPIRKDFEIILAEELSPQGRSKAFANFARVQLHDAQEINRRALGRVPEHETYVDNRKSENLDAAQRLIVFEFDLMEDSFIWIHQMLQKHSPYKTGRYRNNHFFFVDGVEADPTAAQTIDREAFFINAVPYARKIGRGLSRQAPDGVYQVVAKMAQRRFGNSLRIKFSYRNLSGVVPRGPNALAATEVRQPSIVITPR